MHNGQKRTQNRITGRKRRREPLENNSKSLFSRLPRWSLKFNLHWFWTSSYGELTVVVSSVSCVYILGTNDFKLEYETLCYSQIWFPFCFPASDRDWSHPHVEQHHRRTRQFVVSAVHHRSEEKKNTGAQIRRAKWAKQLRKHMFARNDDDVVFVLMCSISRFCGRGER